MIRSQVIEHHQYVGKNYRRPQLLHGSHFQMIPERQKSLYQGRNLDGMRIADSIPSSFVCVEVHEAEQTNPNSPHPCGSGKLYRGCCGTEIDLPPSGRVGSRDALPPFATLILPDLHSSKSIVDSSGASP